MYEYVNDVIALAVTIALISGYHVYLRRLSRRNASAVLSSVATEARTAWVHMVMAGGDHGILAIQTLRNSTMAATFLASTAVLLMVGILTLSGQATTLKDAWHFLNVAGAASPELWLVKLLGILLILFFAFWNFSNAIRIFNHVGYMLPLSAGSSDAKFPPHQVARELNRAGRFFSLGVRSYYYLIPPVHFR
jgi:uncharacterized membrane protein